MKIGEFSRRTGLSAHTIRYYERIGLLPKVDQTKSQHRDYDQTMLNWFIFLGHLKDTGMPLATIRHYATLREQGYTTIPQRREILEIHAHYIEEKRKSLQQNLVLLDKKISAYKTIETSIAENAGVHDADWEKDFQQLVKS